MDIGCGTGSLLETLVIPPSTIYEPPITQKPTTTKSGGPSSYGSTSGSSQEEVDEEEDVDRELFILVRRPLRYFHLYSLIL